MRITIPTLAAAISLTVFACSESPSSPNDGDSSSGGVPLSSSDGTGSGVSSSSSVGTGGSSSSRVSSSSSRAIGITGRACEYSGEDFGINGLFACEEMPVNAPNLQKRKTECEEDGGTWINDCPSGEKTTCIDDEDEDAKDALIKLYADGFTCGGLGLKNANGGTDVVSKGGACGPFAAYGDDIPISLCAEFPELSTDIIKLSCPGLEAPFVNKCPGNADLICYDPEEDMISYFYSKEMLSVTCEDLDMEELI